MAVRGDLDRTGGRPDPDMPGLYPRSGSPVVEPRRAELGQEGLAEERGKRTGLPGHGALDQSGPLPGSVGLYSGVPGSLPALIYPDTECETKRKQKHPLSGAVLVHACRAGPREPEGWGSGWAVGVPWDRTGGWKPQGPQGQLMGCNLSKLKPCARSSRGYPFFWL